MQTISEEVVERTWKKMSDLPFEKMPKLIDAMQKEQPVLVAFLMGMSHDDLNLAERELQFYLGAVVWQIMRQGTPAPKRVPEKRIDELIERTEKMAEYLMGESDVEMVNSSLKIYENHNQRNVLRYVVEALVEEDEELEDEFEEEEEGDESEGPDLMDKLYQITRYERAQAAIAAEYGDEEEDEEADEDEIRSRMKGMIFFNLKIVVEALDQ
ncbi:MAG: hypothetical protein AAB354_15115 [candidate division KSB1 bacterium]